MLPWHTKRRRICTIIFLFIGTFSLSSFKSRREKYVRDDFFRPKPSTFIHETKTLQALSRTFVRDKKSLQGKQSTFVHEGKTPEKSSWIFVLDRKSPQEKQSTFVRDRKIPEASSWTFVRDKKTKKTLIYKLYMSKAGM